MIKLDILKIDIHYIGFNSGLLNNMIGNCETENKPVNYCVAYHYFGLSITKKELKPFEDKLWIGYISNFLVPLHFVDIFNALINHKKIA